MFENINNRIKEILDIDKLSPTEQDNMMMKLGDIVYEKTLIRCYALMSEENEIAFENLVESKSSPEELLMFLKEKIPNIENIVTEEAEKVAKEKNDILKDL